MLTPDEHSMPYYQQKIAGEIHSLEARLEKLRRAWKEASRDEDRPRQEQLEEVSASLRQIQRKLEQIQDLPEEMRERTREELKAALEEVHVSLDRIDPQHDGPWGP